MPAGMVRPRASQVPPLGAGAVAQYRETGWRITEHGRPSLGTVVGPCARCRDPTVRYGQTGHPLCPECRPKTGPAPLPRGGATSTSSQTRQKRGGACRTHVRRSTVGSSVGQPKKAAPAVLPTPCSGA